MKTKLIRSALLGLAALGTLALVSCQAPAHTPTSAVTCSKCHTIHFNAPATSGTGAAGAKGGIVTLRHADGMSCADCENKVVAMGEDRQSHPAHLQDLRRHAASLHQPLNLCRGMSRQRPTAGGFFFGSAPKIWRGWRGGGVAPDDRLKSTVTQLKPTPP
jgi:hypothetical protein